MVDHSKDRWFKELEFTREFRRAETQWLAKRHGEFASMHVSEANQQRYSHGRFWEHPANESVGTGEILPHETEVEIKYDHILNNDLVAWVNILVQVAENMREHFFQMLFSTLHQSTNESGNVVSATAHESNAEAFRELLSKIEFGVDREGEVSKPQMLVSPEMGEKWLAELEAQPPEFKDEIDRIIAQKSEEALAREQERKSRFRSAND